MKQKLAKIYSNFQLKPSKKPKKHKYLAGIVPIYEDLSTEIGHCNISFSDKFVEKVAKLLPFGLSEESPAYVFAHFLDFIATNKKVYYIFAGYAPRFKADDSSVLLWKCDELPKEFGKVYLTASK